jgi:hypothetical protein
MLAQNFLSADALDISENDLRALIKVLGLLERGELKHVQLKKYDCKVPDAFNMEFWDCGTAHCIGGWAHQFGADLNQCNPGIWGLCFPEEHDGYANITVEEAAIALRSYLTCGDAKWAEAFGNRGLKYGRS